MQTIYRFHYSLDRGIYHHEVDEDDGNLRRSKYKLEDTLLDYDREQMRLCYRSPHPKFTKKYELKHSFGFDTPEKFFRYFPIQLLRKMYKVKPKELKFARVLSYKSYMKVDVNQCVFEKAKAKVEHECSMGCLYLVFEFDKFMEGLYNG